MPSAATQAPSSETTVAQARIESLTPAQAEQVRLRALMDASPKAYQDNYLGPAAAAALAADDAKPLGDDPGFRAWLIEGRVGIGESSASGYATRSATEFGLRSEYRRETLNYGEFILQADGRNLSGDKEASAFGIGSLGYARRATSGRYSLRNLAFPIRTGVFADSAIGDIRTETTNGLSRNYRLSLGSSTVRGVSTRLYSRELDLRAGIGVSDPDLKKGNPRPVPVHDPPRGGH